MIRLVDLPGDSEYIVHMEDRSIKRVTTRISPVIENDGTLVFYYDNGAIQEAFRTWTRVE